MRVGAALLLATLLAPLAAAEERVGVVAGAFSPERVVAARWETLRWTWDENATHGVAPDDGGPAWCEPRAGGCTWSTGALGEHRYHCPVHPEMRGAVVIERSASVIVESPRAIFTASAHGLNITFDASATAESPLAIESYAWDFGDNATGAGRIVSHEYPAPGAYRVTLAIVDENGDEHRASRVVFPELEGDTLAAFRTSIAGGTLVAQPLVEEGAHAWSFGDGAATNGTAGVHTYRRAGEFVVTHTLLLPNGTFVRTERVRSEDETTFALAARGFEVAYDASALGRYGNASFSWLFGDTQRAQGERVAHVFPEPGRWSARLTLVDEAGSVELEREVLLVADSPASAPAAPSRAIPVAPLLGLVAACLAARVLRPETYK